MFNYIYEYVYIIYMLLYTCIYILVYVYYATPQHTPLDALPWAWSTAHNMYMHVSVSCAKEPYKRDDILQKRPTKETYILQRDIYF